MSGSCFVHGVMSHGYVNLWAGLEVLCVHRSVAFFETRYSRMSHDVLLGVHMG